VKDVDDVISSIETAVEKREPEDFRQALYFALEEYAKIIDPTPKDAAIFYDGRGTRWHRVAIDPLIWFDGFGVYHTAGYIIERWGFGGGE